MKSLTKINRVNEEQVAFGRRIGLDLENCTVQVALAKIEDLIDNRFWGQELGQPTSKQIELAAKFGYDISSETRRVGSAIIGDIMVQLNLESIEEQNLKPGDVVKIKNDMLQHEYIISSIKETGDVFFRGGNGKRSWARNLIQVG